MSRKATIDNLFVQRGTQATQPPAPSAALAPDRVRTGAISAMGSSLRELTEGAKAASRLQEQLNKGDVIIEIEPKDIDGSMVVDRILTDIDPQFDSLVESIKTSGQQVPILVRPIEGNRFQIAYGHRRVRAAQVLGVKVKALVRQLTNDELVVAQGKENLDRKDLSYIERAQFARKLEEQGFERSVIMTALSSDKTEVSRYLSVARAIPENVIQSIGPAPKTGRPRWVALAEKLPGHEPAVEAVIEKPEFKSLDSDGRFAVIFRALTSPPEKATSWACNKTARIDRKPDRTVLTIDETAAPDFGAYLAGRLDDLYREYLDQKERAA